MLIDTPLLVVGRGPAALVVAKVAAGYGLACVLVGQETAGAESAGDETAGNEMADDESADDETAGNEMAGDGSAGCESADDESAGQITDDQIAAADDPVALDGVAMAALERHGLVDVLRPYFASMNPPAIAPRAFDEVIKHHCVADLNVTVYDQMAVIDRRPVGRGVTGVLTDSTSRWEIRADAFVDADELSTELSAAITAGVAAAMDAVQAAAPPPPH
jgi:hypothetical protein